MLQPIRHLHEHNTTIKQLLTCCITNLQSMHHFSATQSIISLKHSYVKEVSWMMVPNFCTGITHNGMVTACLQQQEARNNSSTLAVCQCMLTPINHHCLTTVNNTCQLWAMTAAVNWCPWLTKWLSNHNAGETETQTHLLREPLEIHLFEVSALPY